MMKSWSSFSASRLLQIVLLRRRGRRAKMVAFDVRRLRGVRGSTTKPMLVAQENLIDPALEARFQTCVQASRLLDFIHLNSMASVVRMSAACVHREGAGVFRELPSGTRMAALTPRGRRRPRPRPLRLPRSGSLRHRDGKHKACGELSQGPLRYAGGRAAAHLGLERKGLRADDIIFGAPSYLGRSIGSLPLITIQCPRELAGTWRAPR